MVEKILYGVQNTNPIHEHESQNESMYIFFSTEQ